MGFAGGSSREQPRTRQQRRVPDVAVRDPGARHIQQSDVCGRPGRRNFLRGATVATALSYSRIMGANDQIRLGVIGAGDRGQYDMGNFVKDSNVTISAVCDVYAAKFDQVKSRFPQAKEAKEFGDHRKLLEMKDLNVILIATPDHWHAETAIDALNAGKDVYVEKPLTLKPEEGPGIVKAARINER